jgi:hypothetical protein
MFSILRHRGGRRRGNVAYGRSLSIECGRVEGEEFCRKVPERCSSEVNLDQSMRSYHRAQESVVKRDGLRFGCIK